MSRFANAVALVTTIAAVVLLSLMIGASAMKSSTAERISVTIRPATPEHAAAADVVSHAGSPGYGSISGRIVLDGEIPELPPIVRKEQMRDWDREICAPDEIPNESLIVDRETLGIANVFVYLPKATHGIHPDLQQSSEKAVLCEMKGCRYVPHALLARTDQVVAVRAVDNCPHNFVEKAGRNVWFQDNPFTRPGEPPIERRHKHPESMPIQVVCDLHSWMSGWWLILDHPYAAISDANGDYSIRDLPAGTYEFAVWQERSGFVNRALRVTITAGETTQIGELRVSAKRFDFTVKSP